jgi:D-glycero-D-manno-heptose 1,7-bisphosphate phosphatase
MRLIVDVRNAGSTGERLIPAAAGLALRGHLVAWAGPPPAFAAATPATWRHARPGPALARIHADVVVAGPTPVRAAIAGRLSRAHGMVLALDGASLRHWGARERLAWGALPAIGLVEPAEAEALRRQVPAGLALEHLGLWSDDPPAGHPDPAHADVEILERACERVLTRRRAADRAAVFVDRDGTLVVEKGYLSDPADIELLPRTARALAGLQAAGHPVIVVSNQSGVGRGFFPLTRVYEAMAQLRVALRSAGVELDGIYFCPHRPDAGCACRKPGVALLERAAEDHAVSLPRSFVVGDKRLDVETAHRARARGVLVRTGYGRDEEARTDAPAPPDAICDDLLDAATWILNQH